MISFISFEFLVFVAITLLLYFCVPMRIRWLVLLGASIYFYGSSGILNLLFVLVTARIAYVIAYNIEKVYDSENADKKQAKKYLIVGIVLIVLLLLYAKIGDNVIEVIASALFEGAVDYHVIVPLGISYYTFSIIGYMADVYWKKTKAEHRYLKLLLYMIYFPHILQGPIPRYTRLARQLSDGHRFHYKNLCYGLQRMMWGYFKKMVLADRLAMFTGAVFGEYTSYEGLVFVVAILCSAVEMYCDFSGCMDIVLGVSEVIDIRLDENFRRPFFSKTAAEFWRRWHITLGTWFKDYVYMPLVINSGWIAFCQRTKGKLGKRFAKNLMNSIPLAVVWILTGVWHNTGLNYIVWGCYWGMLIILSAIYAPKMKKIAEQLRINTSAGWYRFLQIVKTFILYLFSRLLVAPGSLRGTIDVIHRICMKWNPEILFDRTLCTIGWDRLDFLVGIAAVLVLVFVECLQEKGIAIRDKVASFPLALRWGIYYLGIVSILVFGVYGIGEDTFVYMQF